MKNILSTIEIHGTQLLSDEKMRNILLDAQYLREQNENENDENNENYNENNSKNDDLKTLGVDGDEILELSGYNYLVHRSRLLLLRSSVSSISTIITDIPLFCHPYILRTLSLILKVRCINTTMRKNTSTTTNQTNTNNSNSDNKKSKLSKKSSKKNSGISSGSGPRSEMKARVSKEDAAKQAAEIHSSEIKALCDDIGKSFFTSTIILLSLYLRFYSHQYFFFLQFLVSLFSSSLTFISNFTLIITLTFAYSSLPLYPHFYSLRSLFICDIHLHSSSPLRPSAPSRRLYYLESGTWGVTEICCTARYVRIL